MSIGDDLLLAPDKKTAYATLEGQLTPLAKEGGMEAVAKVVCDSLYSIIEKRDEEWRNITYSEVKRERTECSRDVEVALTAYLEAAKGVIDRKVLVDSARDALYARFGNEAPPYGAPEDARKH